MVPRRIFPDRVLGSAFTTTADLKHANAPIVRTDALDKFLDHLIVGRRHARLQDDEAHRHFALQLVGRADDSALRDVAVTGNHFLDRAGRQPMAGDVDDVVDATHHVEIAVVVLVAGVAGQVVARDIATSTT